MSQQGFNLEHIFVAGIAGMGAGAWWARSKARHRSQAEEHSSDLVDKVCGDVVEVLEQVVVTELLHREDDYRDCLAELLDRGRRAGRVQRRGGRAYQLSPKCAACDGYNVHAGVVIGAKDRNGLERLGRYIARPPLAKPRLEERPDGGVRIHFKRPWSDGTEGIDLTVVELVERLAALVPPPRANTVLYHGVLAARSRWVPWAWLLWRAFEVESWACPTCDQRMRLRTVVMAPATLDVLESLHRSARGPPARVEGAAVA